MIKQFAGAITSFLVQENIIEEKDREIYGYGTEQILINVSTLVVICVIAITMNSWKEAGFWLCGMLPIRAVAGGYHASTPVRCNLLTISVFIINIAAIAIVKPYMTTYLLLIFLGVILFSIISFAPVDHKNKVLEHQEFIEDKRKSRIVGIVVILSGRST